MRGYLVLEHRLLVLGVVVLGVLRDVSELTGFLDALRHLATAVAHEVFELVLELLETFLGENDFPGHARRGRNQESALKVMRVKVSFTPASVWTLLVTKWPMSVLSSR